MRIIGWSKVGYVSSKCSGVREKCPTVHPCYKDGSGRKKLYSFPLRGLEDGIQRGLLDSIHMPPASGGKPYGVQ